MGTPPQLFDPQWAWAPFAPSDATPWNARAAAHLFRRAAFGATKAQLDAAVRQTPAEVVEQLVADSTTAANDGAGHDDLAAAVLSTNDPQQLGAWWVYVLLDSPSALRERMTLLWHGHFATSAEKVSKPGLMLEQNRLLRKHALGDFQRLVQAIARNPAMLIYLDSATNRKSHPNENFARELMELFTLGEGNYSERDVQELARCFTGWEIKLDNFRFNRYQHDAGTKTILGKTAAFEEGDSIDWILEQPAAARFVVGKLYRQFICDEPPPPAELLEPLASELRTNGWQIGPVVKRMLGSELFFSKHAVARKVRSPVDLAIGTLRSLEVTTNAHELASDLKRNGCGLFYPPNVKGWDGGRAWINSSTILGRANMMSRLVNDEKTRYSGIAIDEYFEAQGARSTGDVIELLDKLLFAAPLPAAKREALVQACERKPGQGKRFGVVLAAVAALPEFQLG